MYLFDWKAILFLFILSYGDTIIICTLLVRKLSHREIKQFAKDLITCKPTPETMLLTTMLSCLIAGHWWH